MGWRRPLRIKSLARDTFFKLQALATNLRSASNGSVTVRNVADETHRALRLLAAKHGRSMAAEIRFILDSAARPEGRIKLGSLLAEIGREAGGIDLEIARDSTLTEPMSFE